MCQGGIDSGIDTSVGFPASVLATNVIFTSFAVGRLVHYQRRLTKLMGEGNYDRSVYTNISTMIVESAAINVVLQTLALIAAFSSGPMSYIFTVNFLGQTQVNAIGSVISFQTPLLTFLNRFLRRCSSSFAFPEGGRGRDRQHRRYHPHCGSSHDHLPN